MGLEVAWVVGVTVWDWKGDGATVVTVLGWLGGGWVKGWKEIGVWVERERRDGLGGVSYGIGIWGSVLELRRGWGCERGKGLTVLVEEREWGSRLEGRLWWWLWRRGYGGGGCGEEEEEEARERERERFWGERKKKGC
ncbi:uncharacterized protein G2W53_000586 [Senna tora]|uniref:Uncharacterized protein n=1 Tax=Senna tora TaxID=362788 RepID=A0A834XGU4_9FABA|nr:uncharacterized protein G2W53_000586 [Senna tora]